MNLSKFNQDKNTNFPVFLYTDLHVDLHTNMFVFLKYRFTRRLTDGTIWKNIT